MSLQPQHCWLLRPDNSLGGCARSHTWQCSPQSCRPKNVSAHCRGFPGASGPWLRATGLAKEIFLWRLDMTSKHNPHKKRNLMHWTLCDLKLFLRKRQCRGMEKSNHRLGENICESHMRCRTFIQNMRRPLKTQQ